MVKTVSVVRETKVDSKGRKVESRVVFIPEQIKKIAGAQIFVEKDAGAAIDFPDAAYKNAGAVICSRDEALGKDLVLGVKETRLEDFSKLGGNIFLSFQHFAASRERTEAALKTRATFVALETIAQLKNGLPFFPCLAPMSEAAAKVIARHADEYALLAKKIITSGLLETGLHGAKTAVIGGGSVGRTAAEEFSERGCEVFLLDKIPERVKKLEEYFRANAIRFPKVKVLEATPENLRAAAADSFFLVSAMYLAGKRPEKLVTSALLKTMAPGGCVYPVDIDQGGGVEGVFETSILEPFDLPAIPGTEVFFFAPPNLPSIGARTASEALGAVILPYVNEIIQKGIEKAAAENPALAAGINVKDGKITHPGLAAVFPTLPQKNIV